MDSPSHNNGRATRSGGWQHAAIYGLVVFGITFFCGSTGAEEEAGALAGTAYTPAQTFVERYCAGCHTRDGKHSKHEAAYPELHLDTYQDWKGHQPVIRGVIDKWHLDGKIMPPPSARAQPTDAERRMIVAWLARGSPNTKDGK
jgi:uncharacterized membrane protein